MQYLGQLLFESPWSAVVALGILALPLLWLARGRGRLVRAFALSPLLLAALLAAADLLVRTDREKIEDLIDQTVAALGRNDADALADNLSDDFTVSVAGQPQLERPLALDLLKLRLRVFPLASASAGRIEIAPPAGGLAHGRFTLTVRGTPDGQAAGRASVSRWRFDFRKLDDGSWLITSADLREYNGHVPAGLDLSASPDSW